MGLGNWVRSLAISTFVAPAEMLCVNDIGEGTLEGVANIAHRLHQPCRTRPESFLFRILPDHFPQSAFILSKAWQCGNAAADPAPSPSRQYRSKATLFSYGVSPADTGVRFDSKGSDAHGIVAYSVVRNCHPVKLGKTIPVVRHLHSRRRGLGDGFEGLCSRTQNEHGAAVRFVAVCRNGRACSQRPCAQGRSVDSFSAGGPRSYYDYAAGSSCRTVD